MSQTVLISGAGIAGLTLAYWLERFGFRPTVVEHAPALREGGYLIDFFGRGFDVAEKMNLRPRLDAEDIRIREIAFVDQNSRRLGGFDADLIRSLLGGRACNLLRSSLARIIHESLGPKVETLFATSIAAIAPGKREVSVELTRGPARTFDLVVGADGLHSNVRSLVFGKESEFERYYGYYTASFTLDNDLGRELGYWSYTTPGTQVGIYPISMRRVAAFFLFAHKERLRYDRRDTAAQIALLRDAFASQGWICPQLLDRAGMASDFYFDSVSQIQMSRWSEGRVTLVGDACACPSLLSGQGAALAMTGAYVLAGELRTAAGDVGRALARYERIMKPFTNDKQAIARKFAGSLVPKSQLGIWTRNQFSRLMAIRPISRWFMKKFMTDRLVLRDYEAIRLATAAPPEASPSLQP